MLARAMKRPTDPPAESNERHPDRIKREAYARRQRVVDLHNTGLTFREIGKIIGVTDSRIRQMIATQERVNRGARILRPSDTASESNVQAREMLRAARRGAWVLRNNSGAFQDKTGRLVRFGLGNTSKQFNAMCKSSDLVGIEPVLITPDMVGTVIGRAYARECKPEGWRFNPNDPHEVAQKRFIDKINQMGGNAAFTTGTENE
jgi:hypothetical protein